MSTLRAWSKIVIGGEFPDNLTDDLMDAVEESGAIVALEHEDLLDASSAGKPLVLEGDLPSATWDEVEGFCQDHNLTFWRTSDSTREWDGQTTFWAPDGRSYDVIETANGVTVDLWQIEQYAKDGKTIQQLLADNLPPAMCGQDDVPPLVIIPASNAEDDEDGDG